MRVNIGYFADTDYLVIPAALGLVWVWSNALVFYIGAGFAVCSLILAQLIPNEPAPGNETRPGWANGLPAQQEKEA